MFPAGVSDQNPRLHLVLGQVGAARKETPGLSQPRSELIYLAIIVATFFSRM